MKTIALWPPAKLAGIACLAATSQLWAGGLQVSPLRLDFNPKQPIQQLWLGNTGEQSLVAQIELFKWTQLDGRDQLLPNRDFLATPPIVEIPAGERRTIRVGYRQRNQTVCEAAYRIVVSEIPQPHQAGQAPIRFLTRMRLPLFSHQSDDCRPRLEWERQDERLIVHNRGNGHSLIQSLRLEQAQATWPVKLPTLGYVLAGSRRQFTLPQGPDSQPMTLRFTTPQGQYSVPLSAKP